MDQPEMDQPEIDQPDSQPPAVAEAERRQNPRYRVRVPIELCTEHGPVSTNLVTTDLSRNGCYLVMDAPLSVGLRVQATLALGEQRVVTRGRVVTRHPEIGNGILFLEFEGDGRTRLCDFLDGINAQ